jgi:hypothetical protein
LSQTTNDGGLTVPLWSRKVLQLGATLLEKPSKTFKKLSKWSLRRCSKTVNLFLKKKTLRINEEVIINAKNCYYYSLIS